VLRRTSAESRSWSGFGNQRQAAQKGLYLLNSRPPSDLPRDLLEAIPPQKVLKVTLPYEQARELLKGVQSWGYTHSRLFPSYEGAWHELEMRRDAQRLPSC
jgi:hypothetical protein